MSEFTIRADEVDVEQIMQRIRTRIREKRGVDYTEQQIRELAAVKLEKFLDPSSVRSDLLTHVREGGRLELPNYAFEDTTLFESHRAPIRWVRRLLRPLLKLLFNPNPLAQALHIQSGLNTRLAQHTELSYELLHNLVVEITRLGIEVRNLNMRVESVSSRLDFDERRARALEGVVQYRPDAAGVPTGETAATEGGERAGEADGGAAESRGRRRRRRRGRRGGGPPPASAAGGGEPGRDTAPAQPDETPAADQETAPTKEPGPGDENP